VKIKKETLRGYILEEVVARLLRNAGYSLLTNPNQDPGSLDWERHGLVVRGRGATHQADALGQLSWIPAFTYPLRLFVEAKYRDVTTGLPTVRNAVGMLLDVNQFDIPKAPRPNLEPTRQKYQYVTAIFSTSGFTKPAADMAFAHGVSLIDLGTPDFEAVRAAIDSVAEALVGRFAEPDDSEGEFVSPARGEFVHNLRMALRHSFETSTAEPPEQDRELQAAIRECLGEAIDVTRTTNELFVGMANGPFMLALQADDREAFLQFVRRHPTHDVNISWSRSDNEGRTWRITPSRAPNTYRLSFNLPETLGKWIFDSENVRQAALDIKNRFLSEIMIYREDGDRDILVRLRFNKQQINRDAE
jgi:hypothetical protein